MIRDSINPPPTACAPAGAPSVCPAGLRSGDVLAIQSGEEHRYNSMTTTWLLPEQASKSRPG
jgi:hypothetical protein